MTPPKLFFVAAEPSGDLLAREVIDALHKHTPDVQINGIGGTEMASVGVSSSIDTSPLSIFGLFEGLKVYPTVVRLADQAAAAIVDAKPDAVVLVDSWGFMLRVAQRVRKLAPQIKLIKLIGPQVWATRPGRARTLASCVDLLLCMHEMEVPFYEPFDLETVVIGNPALSRQMDGDGAAFRGKHKINHDTPIILVLPGSRRSEIERVAPELMQAALALKQADPRRIVVAAPAPSVADHFHTVFPDAHINMIVEPNADERYNAMAAADIALACSGTVTSELAVMGTPMLVGYRTGTITWTIARGFLYKKTHVTLLNIVSDDQEIVPEFLQFELDANALASKAETWLKDPNALAQQRDQQREALDRMTHGELKTAEIAAKTIIDSIG